MVLLSQLLRFQVKCDGIEPVCNKCNHNPGLCTWDHGWRSQPQDDQIKWLEARVQQLEQSRASVPTDSSPSGMYKGTIEQPSAIEAESENGSSRVDESLAFSLGDVPVQLAKQTVVPDSIESQHTPSILGAGGGQNEEQTFYGSSSAGNFLQNVKKLAAQTVHNGRQSHPNHVTTSNRADASLPNGQQLAQPLADYTLPSRRTADRLVTVYWQQMQPIYPFLDELSFQATYETLWTGNSSVINERSFLYVKCMGKKGLRDSIKHYAAL